MHQPTQAGEGSPTDQLATLPNESPNLSESSTEGGPVVHTSPQTEGASSAEGASSTVGVYLSILFNQFIIIGWG